MAFEMLGIGGVLTFNDTQAARGMTRTKMMLRNVEMRAQRLSMGMRKLGGAVKSLGMISIASAAGMGFGLKAAADFEHQMGAVAAVTRTAGAELRRNSDYARKLGIETAFSATQAASAMEILGKFGLSKEPLRKATKGVTDLAAATGTNMESAATTMIGTLKTMSLTAKDSTRVANVLSMASTKTAANAIGLGEAFAYAGSTGKSMKMSLEMTTAVFGALADKMMTGSRAGTGLMALMRGLQGNTKKVRTTMKGLGIDVKQFGGNMKDMPKIITHITNMLNKKFPKASDAIDRARAVTQMFGRFGQVTFNNLAATGGKKLKALADSLKKSGNVGKKFGKVIGAAAEMAGKRLDTVKGSITLFKSSMESFFISIMGGFLGPMKGRLQALTKQFNKVLFVLNALEKDDSAKNQAKQMKKYGSTTVLVALGVRDALKLVRDSWKFVGVQIRKVAGMFGGSVSGTMLRSIVKFGLGITMLIATLAPLFIGLFAMKFLVGVVATAVSGLVSVISAVALPVIAVVALVAGAFLILRKEGESVRETFTRLFTGVHAFGSEIVGSVLMPMFNSIVGVMLAFTVGIESFWGTVVGRLRAVIYTLIGTFAIVARTVGGLLKTLVGLATSVTLKMKPFFKALIKFGLTVAEVMAGIGRSIANLFKTVGGLATSIANHIKPIILDIAALLSKIGSNMASTFGKVFRVIGFLAKAIINMLRSTLQFLKPVLVTFLKLVKVVWNLGKVILMFVLAPFKMLWAIIKKTYSFVKGPLGTAFKFIGGLIATVLGGIRTAAKWLFTILLAPFKIMARTFAKVMYGAAKMAKYIPGISASTMRGLARSLESFGGMKSISVSTQDNSLLARRGKLSTASMGPGSTGRLFPSTRDPSKRAPSVKVDNTLNANITAKTSIDGKCVAAATAGHQVELSERAGFGSSPWQRRAVIARSGLINPRGRQ